MKKNIATQDAASVEQLIIILNQLREQCPWDKKQTIHTLRHMTIEETFELTEAITDTDWEGIKEELGDVLLHILFYAKIATEENKFEFKDVVEDVCKKLIRRHPHIYPPAGAEKTIVNNEEDVKRNWEKIKLQEGKKSVLSGVPKGLPATIKAMRLQEKAKQIGFEWENKMQVWDKVLEEMQELKQAEDSQSAQAVEEEFGDLIFSLINYARFLNIDAENALELTNKKFISRFTAMEQMAVDSGLELNEMNLTQMDSLWNQAKQNGHN